MGIQDPQVEVLADHQVVEAAVVSAGHQVVEVEVASAGLLAVVVVPADHPAEVAEEFADIKKNLVSIKKTCFD